MARQNKILESGMSETEIMGMWNAGGDKRQELVELLGFASANGLYNALRAIGYIAGGPVNGGGNGGEKRQASGKIKGCLPIKVAIRIARVLDLGDDDEPGWAEFLRVCEDDPDFYGFTMTRLMGGSDTAGGKSYADWVESNQANDRAIAEAAAKAADPTIQLRERLNKANRLLDEREKEIARLTAELAAAKAAASPRRGAVHGGEIDQTMLRLMKQRFHPDRNNGDPETCTRIMQWLNAIAL